MKNDGVAISPTFDLDYFKKANVTIYCILNAQDMHGLETTTSLTIEIYDANDHSPTFSKVVFSFIAWQGNV